MTTITKFKAQAITKNQAMDIKGGVSVEEYCKTNRTIADNNPEARLAANYYYKQYCKDLPKTSG